MAVDTQIAVERTQSFVQNVIGENPTMDLLLLLIAGGAAIFLSLLGRARLVALTLALYATIAFVAATPILENVRALMTATAPFIVAIVVLAVGLVVFYLLIQFSMGDLLEDDHGYLGATVVLAVTLIGMTLSYVLIAIPDALPGLSPMLLAVLRHPVANYLWAAAPLLVIASTRD